MIPVFTQNVTKADIRHKYKGGLLVTVFRSDGDTTLGGVTAKQNTFLLVGDDVAPVVSCKHYPDEQVLVLSDFKGYKRCYALSNLNEQASVRKIVFKGSNGGNFIFSSDSRYHDISDYPLPVHDRIEG